jgi:hypothetical protein
MNQVQFFVNEPICVAVCTGPQVRISAAARYQFLQDSVRGRFDVAPRTIYGVREANGQRINPVLPMVGLGQHLVH